MNGSAETQGLPLVIEVEADAAPAAKPPSIEDYFDELTAAPAERALAQPNQSRADAPPVPAAPADSEEVKNTVLRIVLGDEEKYLKCAQDDVAGFVFMSYLAGGFPLVVRARAAIDAGVGGLGDDATSARKGIIELEKLAADAPSRPDSATAAAQALPQARDLSAAAAANLQRAQASWASFDELFRKAWNTLATYEEPLVRRYDRELLHSFLKIADQNRVLAAKEWSRYAPTTKAKGAQLAFDTAQTDEVAGVALSKSLAEALAAEHQEGSPKAEKSTDEEATLKKAVEQLWRLALELKQLAEGVRVNAAVAAKAERSEDETKRKAARAGQTDRITAWNERRTRIAADYPALLQVYTRFKSVNDAEQARTRFGRAIAEALIGVRDECDRINREARLLHDGEGQLRIVPVAATDRLTGFTVPDSDLDRVVTTRTMVAGVPTPLEESVRLRDALEEGHIEAARRWGLIIPASEVVGAILQRHEYLRRNTGWMHPPVGFDLIQRAQADADLAPYFTPGTVHHAAVSRVLDSVAAQRERERTWRARGLMLMWGVAALLGLFTSGATLEGAALVQAAVSAEEIFESAEEYQHAAGLSAVSLLAIEEAAWRRPSTAALVRVIVADLSDVVVGLVGAKEIPIVLDLALGALAALHPGDEP